jgi:predicted nuclease of restriction endonuclease-like (RecB) superfamily
MAKQRELKRSTSVLDILPEIRLLIEASRYRVAATANLELVSLYWDIGGVIAVDFQMHEKRAGYSDELLKELGIELTREYGRGFSRTNLQDMRRFFAEFEICQTLSGKSGRQGKRPRSNARGLNIPKTLLRTLEQPNTASGRPSEKLTNVNPEICQTLSGKSLDRIQVDFSKHDQIGWSHYVLLMGESDPRRRRFYFDQTANQRWSVRELRRQIQSALFERVALSKNTGKLIAKERKKAPREIVRYDDIFKDPYILDFLELDGAYSEKDLEGKIIHNLQRFLSELGSDFCFIASQFRMRIDADDYFLDLLFFHRGLRCLVAIDLKIGAFTAADKGQMDLYLSWLKRHDWRESENEPIGLILCASKKKQHVELLLASGPHKMQVAEYLTRLPEKSVLEERLRYYGHLLEEQH